MKLRTLYLHENVIETISNVNHLTNLITLNLESNMLKRLDNLEGLVNLQTLQLKRNRLCMEEGLEAIEEVLKLPKVSVLDVQENRIADKNVLEEIFVKMPSLTVLYT